MAQPADQSAPQPHPASERAVVTIIGPDRVGIIAGISAVLAEADANIIDISQTVMRDFFAMIMMVDLARASLPFDALRGALQAKGATLAVQVDIQREDLFKAMHRV